MLVAVALALTAIPSAASAGVVEGTTLYTLPPATHAYSMTAGPEGAIWFTGSQADEPFGGSGNAVVGRVAVDGQVRFFDLPSNRVTGEIVAGPDGNLWFTETYRNERGYTVARLGHMTPSGQFGEYLIGEHVGGTGSMTAGPDGNLWFISAFWKKGRKKLAIARFDVASEELRRFHLPPRSGPTDIVAGPDGNLWFSERGGEVSRIGRITPEGQVTHFSLPDRKMVAGAMTVGPDGNIWFAEFLRRYAGNPRSSVGRIAPSGQIREFRLPEGSSAATLVSGPAGRLWYTARSSHGNSAIGSLSPNGTASELECLPAPSECEIDADVLAVGHDGALWFSASKYWSHMGGGGTGIMESMAEAAEAGQIGRFAP
ncbi:MAG TPA: hypothetical protein VK889_07045 [Solirubrobacterales bacterium]|nr:hypothetical protein [Solirubrobacterales bacterium]